METHCWQADKAATPYPTPTNSLTHKHTFSRSEMGDEEGDEKEKHIFNYSRQFQTIFFIKKEKNKRSQFLLKWRRVCFSFLSSYCHCSSI